MINQYKISAVIPTLNEAQGIRKTMGLVPQCVDEVVVVDGDSRDGTREIAAECGAKVILEKRRGYGRAFKTGFEHCTGDIIVTGDGDGTYPIELVEEVVKYMDAKGLDFVSCNRLPLEDKKSMNFTNFVGNYMMSKAASVMWLRSFKDILSGMWVFRRSCLKELSLYSDGWNFSEEIKLQAHEKLGRRFAEYKIPYRERLGETKLMPWKVGVENICYMMAMRVKMVPTLKSLIKPNAERGHSIS